MVANGSIESETVWNDGPQGGATGGGFSAHFRRPTWQANAVHESGRGVPDVAGNAAPETGYRILVDGQQEVVGGTSAVAPLWAGLIVLLNQKLNRRLGFVNPELYNLIRAGGFRDITMGKNGAYTANHGWNPCCGQGSPMGGPLLQALQGMEAAGVHGQQQSASIHQQRAERLHASQAK
jgi:kumamolisin